MKDPKDIYFLVGCEESQAITIALREKGIQAFSCDLKECSGGHPEWHIQCDVFKVIEGGMFMCQNGNMIDVVKWDAAMFHPDCTYLTVTANKWLKDQPARKSGALVGQARRDARDQAIDFFKRLYNCSIPIIAMENPVGCISSEFMKPTQIVQPYQFGHPEPKKTCLWLRGLPKLVATDHVEPEYCVSKSGKRMPTWYMYADKSKGQAHRAELRSKTFPGMAKAMADQWTDFLVNSL